MKQDERQFVSKLALLFGFHQDCLANWNASESISVF